MRTRPIVAVTIVIVLGLGIGWYVAAQEDITLPVFTPGQVLTAQELNNMIEALDNLRNQVNLSEGRLTCDTQGSCNSDQDLSDECQDFVLDCFSVADPQGCIGGGVSICEEEELPDGVDEENVCDQVFCNDSESQRNKCLAFLGACLNHVNLPEKCVAGALWVCTNPFHQEPGL